jgi:hypothetical protein
MLIKQKISHGAKNRTVHGMQGKSHSDSTKKKISESNKGTVPWNKGKKSPKTTGTGNGFYGKTHSADTKLKISEASKNKPRKTCQYCHNDFDVANYSRSHGIKCKLKDGNPLVQLS